jgi:hypothetical protein
MLQIGGHFATPRVAPLPWMPPGFFDARGRGQEIGKRAQRPRLQGSQGTGFRDRGIRDTRRVSANLDSLQGRFGVGGIGTGIMGACRGPVNPGGCKRSTGEAEQRKSRRLVESHARPAAEVQAEVGGMNSKEHRTTEKMGSRNFHATLRAGIIVTCGERPPLAADRHWRHSRARTRKFGVSQPNLLFSHVTRFA